MGELKVKLGCMLTFNESTEEDIVNTVENLKSKHKLGKFINALLRVAHDNPEVMKLVEDEYNGEISSRDEFFKELKVQVAECKDNIEVLNDEIASTIAAYKYGANSGLLNKSYNVALASIANDRHLQQLNRRLYGSLAVQTDKRLLNNVEKVADLAVEKVVNVLQNVEVELMIAKMQQAQQVTQIIPVSGTPIVNNSQDSGNNMINNKVEEPEIKEEVKPVKEKPSLDRLAKFVGK